MLQVTYLLPNISIIFSQRKFNFFNTPPIKDTSSREIDENVPAPKISFTKNFVDVDDVIATIRSLFCCARSVIEGKWEREERQTSGGMRSITDYELQRSAGSKVTIVPAAAWQRFGNPFPNLAIRLTSTVDSTAKLIGSSRIESTRCSAPIRNRVRIYNLYEL